MTPVSPNRLPPLPAERVDDECRAAIVEGFGEELAKRYVDDGEPMPGVIATMLHHPRVAGPFWRFNGVLLRASTLDPRLRELMILRVGWRTRSRYEFLQHVKLGSRYGVTPEEVDTVVGVADRVTWTPIEALLLRATDQLIDRYVIDDDTWTELGEHLDEQQRYEVVFVVGTYVCLAMAFNSFGLELDPDLHHLAAPAMPEGED